MAYRDGPQAPARTHLHALLPVSATRIEVSMIVTDLADFQQVCLGAILMGGRVDSVQDGLGCYQTAQWTGDHGIEYRAVGPTVLDVDTQRLAVAATCCPDYAGVECPVCDGTGRRA